MDAAYRLIFPLPPSLILVIPDGRYVPCLAACVVRVRNGVVWIDGPSRERLFDQARRFLRQHTRGLGAKQFVGVITTPPNPARGIPRGRDGWSIIINSDVTFAPTTLEADIRPVLQLVDAEMTAS